MAAPKRMPVKKGGLTKKEMSASKAVKGTGINRKGARTVLRNAKDYSGLGQMTGRDMARAYAERQLAGGGKKG